MATQDDSRRGHTGPAIAEAISLVDEIPADEQNEDITEQNLETNETDLNEQELDEDETEAVDWGDLQVPDRLQGKTLPEVLNEFTSMHSEFGRQARELGEARSLMRDIVQERLATPVKQAPAPTAEPITAEDFEKDPQAVINAAVQAAIQPLVAQQQTDAEKAKQDAFAVRNPNYQEIVQSPEFADWVKADPIRLNAYRRANDYDLVEAQTLLDGFNAFQQSQAKGNTTQRARQNQTITGGGGKTGRKVKGKIFKAVDIQRQFNEDREAYNAHAAEYDLAFKEGRVK